jgi:imidazolonepropionase
VILSAREKVDRIWRNGRFLVFAQEEQRLEVIEDGALAAANGRIAFVGPERECRRFEAAETVDLDGRLVTPGLIDCHTHLVYAGDRASEFEMRLAGASYESIARAGGGVLSTMRATRAATDEQLVQAALPRLDALIAEGVTTVEIKSGYGLEIESEKRMLAAARRLDRERRINVFTTFLGLHALPPEAEGFADGYVDTLCRTGIPVMAAAELADAFDAFCEGVAFSPAQVARAFGAAREARMPLKLHADQLSNLHGAKLAADNGALSADHLEYTDEEGVAAMAQSGTVAVLLPGAFYTLRERQLPPVEALRRYKVPMAVATDCNPGTSPMTSLLLAMNMAATLFGLTVDEVVAGVTRHAAQALGRLADIGTLEAGKRCDLAIWNAAQPVDLVYRLGFNPLYARVFGGT